MGVNIRGPVDPVVEAIAGVLRRYTDAHPAAEADVHRYSNVIVQVRVVDPDFCGVNVFQRPKFLWPILDTLDDDTRAELTTLRLLTPDEKGSEIDDIDFDNPVTFDEEYAALQASRNRGRAAP